MKKLFVVSKTHLDLGFTDYAETIRQKYIHAFIPSAIALAERVNTPEKKSFIWTVGSWILKQALNEGSAQEQEGLRAAIRRGDIVPHAMPFTTHTELLDTDTLTYGLSIVDGIDALRGRKTVAAKMTDVPGHTRGLVELLSRHGVKMLHIGVNGASALVEVPPCFLWKSDGFEVVVVYSGDYGGAFRSGFTEEILYFDHTLDNHGTPSEQKVLARLAEIKKEYPDYEVAAGCMDDFADILWEKRANLPVVEGEMGDTWIHGSASDPYKSAALRTLLSLKRDWLAEGSMIGGSAEHAGMSDALLCIAEHTCGMDMKRYFSDFENYLKPDFKQARKADRVKLRHPLRDFPQNVLTAVGRLSGVRCTGFYSVIEKSWAEQREYIGMALQSLSPAHREAAEQALSWLRPGKPESPVGSSDPFAPIQCGGWRFTLNKNGGIGSLSHNGTAVIRENEAPVVEYHSYCQKDYDFWLTHYTRNLKETFTWAVGDFARPLLKYAEGKYPAGRFPYQIKQAVASADAAQVCVDLVCDPLISEQLGAPRLVQIVYTLNDTGLTMDAAWFGKDANRLTEAIFLRLFPAKGELRLRKCNTMVDPGDVVSMGGRNLHAAEYAQLRVGGSAFRLTSCHAPVLSVGRGKILEFDNRLEDMQKDGLSYLLYDNVWGTNFPLWYEENARFRFTISGQDAPCCGRRIT